MYWNIVRNAATLKGIINKCLTELVHSKDFSLKITILMTNNTVYHNKKFNSACLYPSGS